MSLVATRRGAWLSLAAIRRGACDRRRGTPVAHGLATTARRPRRYRKLPRLSWLGPTRIRCCATKAHITERHREPADQRFTVRETKAHPRGDGPSARWGQNRRQPG